MSGLLLYFVESLVLNTFVWFEQDDFLENDFIGHFEKGKNHITFFGDFQKNCSDSRVDVYNSATT